jgi:hypothetical protein
MAKLTVIETTDTFFSRYYILAIAFAIICRILKLLYFTPLRNVPGPCLYRLTAWPLRLHDFYGTRTISITRLHKKYGPVIRIGPNELSFASLTAQKTIYGPGSKFGRTQFYRAFDVYGVQNMFTFHDSKQHAERKRLIAGAYAKSSVMKGSAGVVEEKAARFLMLLEKEMEQNGGVCELFSALHYFSLDSITEFLYGPDGATDAMGGAEEHRQLIGDILDPARRRLAWFVVHLPKLTKWMYSRTGTLGSVIEPFLPMRKPATYTGIREYALKIFYDCKNAKLGIDNSKEMLPTHLDQPNQLPKSIISHLWPHHASQKKDGLSDLEMASELADHLLAGIDTTSDTLMFLIWALSLPSNQHCQNKLIEEIRSIPSTGFNAINLPTAEISDKLPYLAAVLKETLRLYGPLPASEPRSCKTDILIDGYMIPAKTVVGMQPHTLHRNDEVFKEPGKFYPERWFAEPEVVVEMKKWWWAFSSGARMCIGMQ